MLVGDLTGQLRFIARVLVDEGEGRGGRVLQRLPLAALRETACAEKPQTVADDAAAERRFVHGVDLVDLCRRVLRAVLRLSEARPLVVRERVADGAAELIAARLRDGVDDAAGETAVLRRD